MIDYPINFQLRSKSGVEVVFTQSTEDKKSGDYSREYWEAIEKNDAGSIRKLIEERKLDVNTCDKYGNTALHYASQNGYLEIIDVLLENGAGVNCEGENKFTPLHAAITNNHKEVAKRLLGKGADPKVRDSSGNSSLHFAAEQNNLELLKLVVGSKVDIDEINAKNKYDWSVLHSAASGIINKKEKENWEIIKWLLESGADCSAIAKNSFTIEDVFEQEDWSYADHYRRIIDNFSTISHQETN